MTDEKLREIPLGWQNVGISASFLVLNVLLSAKLELQLSREIIVAAIRCVVQLTILSEILTPVLNEDNIYMVFGLTLLQSIISVAEIMYVRATFKHDMMVYTVFGSTFLGSAIVALLGNAYAIGSVPFYASREFIPTFGMIIGNVFLKC